MLGEGLLKIDAVAADSVLNSVSTADISSLDGSLAEFTPLERCAAPAARDRWCERLGCRWQRGSGPGPVIPNSISID